MSNVITFGKHKGKTIVEIQKEDMNWLMWFSRNYDPYQNSNPSPYVKLKKSTIDARLALLNEARAAVKAHFEVIEEKNREEYTSEFLFALGSKAELPVTIKKVDEKSDYTVITGETEDKDLVRFYDKGYNLSPEDVVTLKGTVSNHREICGIKYTYFNRIKVNA